MIAKLRKNAGWVWTVCLAAEPLRREASIGDLVDQTRCMDRIMNDFTRGFTSTTVRALSSPSVHRIVTPRQTVEMHCWMRLEASRGGPKLEEEHEPLLRRFFHRHGVDMAVTRR
jgi:hypothetical protein